LLFLCRLASQFYFLTTIKYLHNLSWIYTVATFLIIEITINSLKNTTGGQMLASTHIEDIIWKTNGTSIDFLGRHV
jgi:hypothetical protein